MSTQSLEFESIRFISWEMEKGNWTAINAMLRLLSDEEFGKIPSILEMPTVKEAAEKYGICDSIPRNNYKYWVDVYAISGSIFKGESKTYNP